MNRCCRLPRTPLRERYYILFNSLDSLTKDPPVDRYATSGTKSAKIRNLIGFWLLGLCNNYAYVIMLSAAHDILAVDYDQSSNVTITTPASHANSTTKACNKLSTGAILLADILPSLFIKAIAPFIGIRTYIRVFLVIVLSAASFLNVALSSAAWMAFLGVVCASLSSGLGETTLLGYSSYFDRNVVSTWSSGTGASGIFGAVSYAALTSAKVSARTTLLIMLVIPVLMAITFYILIVHPKEIAARGNNDFQPLLLCTPRTLEDGSKESVSLTVFFKEKFSLMKPLWKYALPLMLVYFAEYFINQGLTELIEFKNIWLDKDEQYRWYQVDYQLGVFLSRSSVNLFVIDKLWLLTLFQFVNVGLFLAQVETSFLPSIWLVLALVLFEGLLGGGAYVNTYYKMTKEIPQENLAFSMACVPLADTIGIAIAGAVALPVHDYFCSRF